MSTEHQQYSLDNQKAVNEAFAAQHQFEIVMTYSDAGRSGLVIKNRPGLMQLLQDVVSGPEFAVILVYDVSRWGRFQDTDEAAHYEFICRRSGVPIFYCAEQFSNDGSVASAILKSMKRAMAGEYSREMGVKVYAGQKRLVQMGFKMGGLRPLGYQRVMVAANRERKTILRKGEYKNLETDRVVLTPGSAAEVRLVRQIFRLAGERHWRPFRIAKYLNGRGLRNLNGGRWTHKAIRQMLENPTYLGWNVWGRTSQRLHAGTRQVSSPDWVVKTEAFAPILNLRTFQRAQESLLELTRYRSDEELLDKLRRLLAQKGRLSQSLIAKCKWIPSAQTYTRRFGDLYAAYDLLGYRPKRDWKRVIQSRRVRQRIRADLLGAIRREFPEIEVLRPPKMRRGILRMPSGECISVLLCPTLDTASGLVRWKVTPHPEENCGVVLLCLLNKTNTSIQDMYICPPASASKWFYLAPRDASLEKYRVRNIAALSTAVSNFVLKKR